MFFSSRLIWDPPFSLFVLPLLSFLCCLIPAYLEQPRLFVSFLFFAFLFVLFESRLVWDSPAVSFLSSFSLSCLFCLDPSLSGTSPFRFNALAYPELPFPFLRCTIWVFLVPRWSAVATVASKSLMKCLSCSLLLVFLRSRLIWDPPVSLFVLPLLSFLCCLDPGLSGTAPLFRFFPLFRFPVCFV